MPTIRYNGGLFGFQKFSNKIGYMREYRVIEFHRTERHLLFSSRIKIIQLKAAFLKSCGILPSLVHRRRLSEAVK